MIKKATAESIMSQYSLEVRFKEPNKYNKIQNGMNQSVTKLLFNKSSYSHILYY